jgi:glycine oxidase
MREVLGLTVMRKDIIIVGGGVIGCSIALRLAQAGLKVAVVERGRVGCEASRAAAGMLSPQSGALGPSPFFDLCIRSRSMYQRFAAELQELSGINVEYRSEGSLVIATRDQEEKEMMRSAAWQVEAGLALEFVSPESIHKIEPAVTKSATGAVFIPGDHQVDNRRLMDALDESLRRAGAEVISGLEVDSLILERGRVTGVATRRGPLHAGEVVIAAGCWSSKLLDPLGLNIATTPARGQMVAVRGETTAITHALHSGECYLVPRRDGKILVGATVEYVGYQKGTTAGGIGHLLAAAIEMVPAIKDFEIVETWSGLRPDTSDHLPLLGRTGVDNLLLATGHFRDGILLAPVTAELIAGIVVDNQAPIELGPFAVERALSRPSGNQATTPDNAVDDFSDNPVGR